MADYDFSYSMPKDWWGLFINFLSANNQRELASLCCQCIAYYDDVGLAYYAGMKGKDYWNKHALVFTLETNGDVANSLKPFTNALINELNYFLKPSVSGFVVRRICFSVNSSIGEIIIPDSDDDSLEMLKSDIESNLGKGKPALALDRLHTYLTGYIRKLCTKYSISVLDGNNKYFSLHKNASNLVKHYEEKGKIATELSSRILKTSFSLLDSFDDIRNDYSFAHFNKLPSDDEAYLIVRAIVNVIDFIDKIENQ